MKLFNVITATSAIAQTSGLLPHTHFRSPSHFVGMGACLCFPNHDRTVVGNLGPKNGLQVSRSAVNLAVVIG